MVQSYRILGSLLFLSCNILQLTSLWSFIQESTLHLVLRLRGGAKKRKKKSYTTPKKNKHKRKKVKLAVLKYYKVSYNSEIQHLLNSVFFASHMFCIQLWEFLVWFHVVCLDPQVDENGKIHRLRRECPADECGAGVFMASHFDRHYCGKCCLTYCFNKPEDKWSTVLTTCSV